MHTLHPYFARMDESYVYVSPNRMLQCILPWAVHEVTSTPVSLFYARNGAKLFHMFWPQNYQICELLWCTCIKTLKLMRMFVFKKKYFYRWQWNSFNPHRLCTVYRDHLYPVANRLSNNLNSHVSHNDLTSMPLTPWDPPPQKKNK